MQRLLTLIFLLIGFFSQGGFAMTPETTKIVQLGDPVLRQKARALSLDEIHSPKIQALIQTMHNTMRGVGVGLAAPQIGYSLQIAVIEDLQSTIDLLPQAIRDERGRHAIPFHVLINPEIIEMSADHALFFEGCLSVSNGVRITPRAKRITVKFLNERGEERVVTAEGWYARILQHEIGHLQGKLFLDFADANTEVSFEEYKEKWANASAAEIKKLYLHRGGN